MSDLFKKELISVFQLLEGLGKAKATQDDVFDQHAANLVKQSKACERLYRDLKAYGAALRTMVQAQKTFRETIRELYETDWPDREHLCAITQLGLFAIDLVTLQSLDLQWDEFEKIVNDRVMGSVNAYMAQFSDLKAKVAKRGRKLVDFDGARNNYATVKAGSKKGDDDPKVVKALADLQQAETLYRELNRELVDALPATYDSRITFFVDTLQTIFNAESTNHTECGKNNKTLVALLDNLGNSFDSLRVPRNSSDHSVAPSLTDEQSIPAEGPPQKSEVPIRESQPTSPLVSSETFLNRANAEHDDENVEKKVYPSLTDAPPAAAVLPDTEEHNSKKSSEKSSAGGDGVGEKDSKASLNPFDDDDDDDTKNPFNENNNGKEPHPEPRSPQKGDNRQEANADRKILYKVRATHRYTAEDTDELTFDAGEVITVLEAREEDLLDDGWLFGVKQSDGVYGVFPANFTKSL
uniref:SH3 domain-containing protein n=1 Tax=Elaeophora elaphi TaxID=1147741 RepID=A0A0R3S6D4_9BILA